jgi:HD-like signal output (HDOD) protein/ActR/RegA family two-component response regulator
MMRILFVDDEVRVLEALRRMLHPLRFEWQMEFAPGGEAALALMESSTFDVIVSDMRMPGMDGATLLTEVRERYPQTVRIVLSGHTEMETALRAVPVAHQFLAKPCDGEMLRVAIERSCHLQALLNDKSVRGCVGALGDLPALPRIYDGLTQALSEPDASLQKIAEIVAQDVGISAKILQLANSAFFGVSKSVTNIQNAVSYLGFNTLRCLVLSVEVFRVFKVKSPVSGFSLDALQRHATLTAHIVAHLPVPKHLMDIAIVSCMLHDVGKLIEAWKLPKQFAEALEKSTSTGQPLYRIEEEAYGFSHAEIGGYLLGLWGLPYSVVEAVALHHSPTRVPQRSFDAIGAVYVANILAHRLETHPGVSAQVLGFEMYRENLVELGVWDDIAQWHEAVKDITI